MKMNVLHVYKTSVYQSFGGVETFIDTLCSKGHSFGVLNSVLTLDSSPNSDPILINGYSIHQSKQNFYLASTGFSASAFRDFQELAKESDIIHYHFPNPFADLLHLITRPNKPSVVTYHSDIIRQKLLLQFYLPIQRKFLSSVDRIIATSPNYLSSSQTLKEFENKVSVIPIGIDHLAYESPSLDRLKFWRKKIPQPYFIFIGAMRYYKGLEILLNAVRDTNIHIVIVGTGEFEKSLKIQASELQLRNVDFLGIVNDQDKLALLYLSHGFVFPSHMRSEAFGVSLLEAAAVGRPLISCEIGTGTSFVNINNETGIVISPGSPEELRRAMKFLLNNPRTASKMGNNAKERSLNLFTAHQQAQAYFKVYSELLGRRGL